MYREISWYIKSCKIMQICICVALAQQLIVPHLFYLWGAPGTVVGLGIRPTWIDSYGCAGKGMAL